MSNITEIDLFKQTRALSNWSTDCRKRIEERYPGVSFDATMWPVYTLHRSTAMNVSLVPGLADFAEWDPTWSVALRCVAAELVLSDNIKVVDMALCGFRLLKSVSVSTPFELRLADLRELEKHCLRQARKKPSSAGTQMNNLSSLTQAINLLCSKNVTNSIRYVISKEVKAQLSAMQREHRVKGREENMEILDRKIEALNVATQAMLDRDPRLTPLDECAIALLNLEMCAPSRINEPMCMSLDDYATVECYAENLDGNDGITVQKFRSAQQQLILKMKGSKGAQWSPKPALTFMMTLFHECRELILAKGQRSRMLVTWYEQNPTRLYLPQELEGLRGQNLTQADLQKIVFLGEVPQQYDSRGQIKMSTEIVRNAFQELKDHIVIECNKDRRGRNWPYKTLPWNIIEPWLLQRVRAAMESCRRVTDKNRYEGMLSRMLCLFDGHDYPFLPSAMKVDSIRERLHESPSRTSRRDQLHKSSGKPREVTLFARLGITMPVAGVVQTAYIDTHDPRRWLTTQAMQAQNRLSDVLINKWANRLNLGQLGSYDFRKPETKAEQSAMPGVKELDDLAKGIEAVQRAERMYGLETALITVGDAAVTTSSLDAIAEAVEGRPVAKTSGELVVVFPTLWGCCIHEHHVVPCRSWSTSCTTCDRHLVVKGHLPTNDALRVRQAKTYQIILTQLEKLITARNRKIADEAEMFDAHLLHLAERGLDAKQMADQLIEQFSDIRDSVKDTVFRERLHEAFVNRGLLQRLDDSDVASGALIKYHNPTRHGSPGLERALDAHGGREQIERENLALISRFPIFAPTQLGLKEDPSRLSFTEDEKTDAVTRQIRTDSNG
ncbi:hypothetical protein AEP_01593 [Curvibacter sp. AEP1-3]|uniref:hypothetical protein n=1 Tax=Curvibacter sp. AEP1-3 TaxID=1844971 RepID=UPI000B3CC3F8|nr:hypothetical protein [Curvibacter sp. AEP1-3]ARV18537.1 hypothetical protein AEP_01593 [Curvibacter sp. AEP1-3]